MCFIHKTLGVKMLIKPDFNANRTHEIVSIRMFNIQFYSDLIFRMSKLYKEDKYVRRMCVEFGDELIENRKQVCEKKLDINTNVIEEDDDKDEFLKKPKIFVDHLLKVTDEGGRQFTESEVRDHVFTTISAVSIHFWIHSNLNNKSSLFRAMKQQHCVSVMPWSSLQSTKKYKRKLSTNSWKYLEQGLSKSIMTDSRSVTTWK